MPCWRFHPSCSSILSLSLSLSFQPICIWLDKLGQIQDNVYVGNYIEIFWNNQPWAMIEPGRPARFASSFFVRCQWLPRHLFHRQNIRGCHAGSGFLIVFFHGAKCLWNKHHVMMSNVGHFLGPISGRRTEMLQFFCRCRKNLATIVLTLDLQRPLNCQTCSQGSRIKPHWEEAQLQIIRSRFPTLQVPGRALNRAFSWRGNRESPSSKAWQFESKLVIRHTRKIRR